MLWCIGIAIGLLCAFLGVVARVNGVWALQIGVLLAIAISGALAAATWFYGKNKFWLNKQRRLFSSVTFIVLAGTLSPGAYYVLQPPSPIAISPSRVDLIKLSDLANLKGYINLTVHNRDNDPQYDVWVKLVISSKILWPEALDVDFPTMEELSLSVKAMLDMAVGTMCLGGKDKYKNPAFLCVIDKLGPKDMFTIKLASRVSVDASSKPENIGHLSAFVVRYSDHPSQHFDQSEGQPAASSVDHTPPEPFDITSMVHFCPNIAEAYKLPKNATCTPNSRHNFKASD